LWDSEYHQQQWNSYNNLIGAATAKASVDTEILRKMMKSDSDPDVSLSAAVALARMGYRDGVRLLIDSDSMVFGLNALRNPPLFRRLDQKPVTWRLYATYEEIHRKLASEAGLILEGPPEGTHAHHAWKNVHNRLWKWGRAPSLAESFEMAEDSRWSVVLEDDRIRIVPSDQARELWIRWLDSQPK